MTSCANAEQSESVGGGGFPLPLVQHVCLVCSEATQHPFLTHNRDTSFMDKVCFKEWKSPERQPGQRKASSPLQLRSEFPMKTMRAGVQWWGTRWVIPKCMSQMNSPEWLREGETAQARPHQNAHRSGRKCSRGPPHQCPGPGMTAGTLREGIQREKTIKEKEGGNKEEKKRRVGKTEEERKWKCVRSENQKKKEQKTNKKTQQISYIEGGKKYFNTSKQKHSTKGKTVG